MSGIGREERKRILSLFRKIGSKKAVTVNRKGKALPLSSRRRPINIGKAQKKENKRGCMTDVLRKEKIISSSAPTKEGASSQMGKSRKEKGKIGIQRLLSWWGSPSKINRPEKFGQYEQGRERLVTCLMKKMS